MRVYNRIPIEQRFWSKVLKSDGCWEWKANKHIFGYGLIFDEVGKKPKTAHRVSWEIHQGSIPKGLCVLHKCDNPSCVRPDHLFLGTHQENMIDKTRKGRVPKGSLNKSSKINEKQAFEIKVIYALGGISMKKLGNQYGVSSNVVCRIVNSKLWTHATKNSHAPESDGCS